MFKPSEEYLEKLTALSEKTRTYNQYLRMIDAIKACDEDTSLQHFIDCYGHIEAVVAASSSMVAKLKEAAIASIEQYASVTAEEMYKVSLELNDAIYYKTVTDTTPTLLQP